VTTPTPAGWYPDPDGSGGQRYWDGSAWTDHRSPATPAPEAPADPPVSEQPTTVVTLPGGAHRKAEPEPEPEPEAEPGPTAVIDLASVTPPSEQATSVIRTPLSAPPPPPPAQDRRRKLLIGYGSACAALLAVLVVVLVYAFLLHKDNSVQVGSGPTSTSKSATPATTSAANGWGGGTETASETPTAASGSGPQAADGGMTFAVTGVETAPSVKYQDAPVEKTAQGEFFIVHLTVQNSGDAAGTFLGTLQKLKAGGTVYSIDDEATAYLNGTYADISPGDTADVAIAFDVPPGTSPESLEVHGEPLGAGVDVPLS
jgi:hypothetical protein